MATEINWYPIILYDIFYPVICITMLITNHLKFSFKKMHL